MKRKLLTLMIISTIIIVTSLSPVVNAELTTFDDYQFVTDTHIQAHSWTFDLTVKNPAWSVTGRILTYRFYDMNDTDPVNYISPVDILIGNGPLLDGAGEYNMSYSWGNRYVNVSFYAATSEVDTVLSSMGNVHCIARNQDSLNFIKSVQNGSLVKLSGYLVDVAGRNVTGTLHLKTDTQFGNEDCEILVISDAVPGDVTSADLMVVYILVGAINVSTIMSFIIHRYDKKRCVLPTKKVGKLGKQ